MTSCLGIGNPSKSTPVSPDAYRKTQQLNEQAENPQKEAGRSGRIGASSGISGKPGPQARQSDQDRPDPADALSGVSAKLINAACKITRQEIGNELAAWNDIINSAQTLQVLIGLSKAAYEKAVISHGKFLPAACLAVVAEKALRDPAQISSPGGYFCAMIDRANDQKLNLAKSLRALANETT